MINTDEIRLEKNVPRKERRLLWREYFFKVNRRANMLRCIVLSLYIPTFVFAGFTFYYLIKIYFNFRINNMFFVWSSAFVISTTVNFILLMKNFGGYWRWLWKEKNILTHYWPKKNFLDLDKQRFYYDQSKEDKCVLRKEFRTKAFKHVKLLYWTAVVMIFFATSTTVYELLMWIFFGYQAVNMWFWMFILVLTACDFFITINTIYYGKFWPWLEYEKNIVMKGKSLDTHDKNVIN